MTASPGRSAGYSFDDFIPWASISFWTSLIGFTGVSTVAGFAFSDVEFAVDAPFLYALESLCRTVVFG